MRAQIVGHVALPCSTPCGIFQTTNVISSVCYIRIPVHCSKFLNHPLDGRKYRVDVRMKNSNTDEGECCSGVYRVIIELF